jgi:hypothetical protein
MYSFYNVLDPVGKNVAQMISVYSFILLVLVSVLILIESPITVGRQKVMEKVRA